MQEGIHPEYGPVVFYDRSADKYFLTKSTRSLRAQVIRRTFRKDRKTRRKERT